MDEKYVEVGELVELDDGLGTIFCLWYPKRLELPPGTKIYYKHPPADSSE